MRRSFRLRLRIIAGIIAFAALFLVVRLYVVQIIHGSDYALRANQQYVGSIQELYDRGNIYFTLKDGTLISAATLASGYLVAIDPEDLKNPSAVYAALSAQMPLDANTFYTAAAKTNTPYVALVHHLSESTGQAIANLNIPGVLVETERWRIYPGGSEAAQALGFVGYGSGNTLSGQAGIEEYYNSERRKVFLEISLHKFLATSEAVLKTRRIQKMVTW
jgi:cell division protein FtsI (penicillin-binding protein 3)